MRKYGIENFSIEEIDSAKSFKELGQLERKYIKEYDSQNRKKGYNITAGGESNQWDGNSSAKLSYDEVVQIREIYSMGELRLGECWKMYSDRISYSGFQKIWNGSTWKGILDEVYTEENIKIHRRQHSNPGSKNGNAKLNEIEVLDARKFYVDHTLKETYEKYGIQKGYSLSGFREVLKRTFKHIPMYHKVKKQWIIKDEIIDINNYKPVSTISKSGE